MKKFLISMLCVLSLLFSIGFTACGETEEEDKKPGSSSTVGGDGWTDNY